jgi:hypothetical protein
MIDREEIAPKYHKDEETVASDKGDHQDSKPSNEAEISNQIFCKPGCEK